MILAALLVSLATRAETRAASENSYGTQHSLLSPTAAIERRLDTEDVRARGRAVAKRANPKGFGGKGRGGKGRGAKGRGAKGRGAKGRGRGQKIKKEQNATDAVPWRAKGKWLGRGRSWWERENATGVSVAPLRRQSLAARCSHLADGILPPECWRKMPCDLRVFDPGPKFNRHVTNGHSLSTWEERVTRVTRAVHPCP